MVKIKNIILEISYFFICIILGLIWGVTGIYGIFKPIFSQNYAMQNLSVSFLSIIFGFYLINFWIKRHRKKIRLKEDPTIQFQVELESNRGEKIGGWLIWVCIGLFVNASTAFNNIDFYENEIFTNINYNVLLSNQNHTSIITSLKLGYYITAISLALFVGLIIEIFRRKKYFPTLFIITFILLILMHILDYLFAISMPDNPLRSWKIQNVEKDLMLSVGSSIIWIWYFLKSKRVARTFVK